MFGMFRSKNNCFYEQIQVKCAHDHRSLAHDVKAIITFVTYGTTNDQVPRPNMSMYLGIRCM